MKSKELKLMRKKLAKANKIDYRPSPDHCELVANWKRDDPTAASDNHGTGPENGPPVKFAIELYQSKSLPASYFQKCVHLFQENMGDLYRNSSWSLSMAEKESEMKHDSARFILVSSPETQDLAAFCHYRFECDDDEYPTQPVLYLYEIQINQIYRRQGLGKLLMSIVEALATKAEMPKVMLTVFKANQGALDFYEKLDYVIDENSPSQCNHPSADYEILSRQAPYKV